MYSSRILELAGAEIERNLRQMPTTFTSAEFIEVFSAACPNEYDAIVDHFATKAPDRPHAIQMAHVMLMHTVNDRFHHIARKFETIPNPKGGEMSRWRKD